MRRSSVRVCPRLSRSTVPRGPRETAGVHDHLALIDARVAEAAEAWLNDPYDAAVYARLVLAVRARREYLEGPAGAVEVQPGPEWARLRQAEEVDRGGDPGHAHTALTAQSMVPSDLRPATATTRCQTTGRRMRPAARTPAPPWKRSPWSAPGRRSGQWGRT